jgi:hypothetical protein
MHTDLLASNKVSDDGDIVTGALMIREWYYVKNSGSCLYWVHPFVQNTIDKNTSEYLILSLSADREKVYIFIRMTTGTVNDLLEIARYRMTNNTTNYTVE